MPNMHETYLDNWKIQHISKHSLCIQQDSEVQIIKMKNIL